MVFYNSMEGKTLDFIAVSMVAESIGTTLFFKEDGRFVLVNARCDY